MTFVPNPLLETELEHSGMLERPLEDIAQGIASKAQAIAPVDTGAYRDSISAVSGEDDDGKSVARVLSDSPYGAFLEFGTVSTPVFATLRRASEGG